MALPYTQNVPEDTQSFQETQPTIQTNFGSIQTLLEENHVMFGDTNQGCHDYLIMPTVTTPPDAVNGSTDLLMYQQGSPNQIWLKYPNNAVVQLTGTQVPSTGTSGPGWSRFPSGIIMKWGTATIAKSTSVAPVVFPVGVSIPVFTKNPSYVKVTPTSTGASTFNKVFVTNIKVNGFSAGGELNTSFTINWFAIGV